MKRNIACLLGATALSTLSAASFADGIDSTVLTEGQVIGQMSQLATVSGGTGMSAYSFAPEWSEELGFSATGALGFRLQENSALGLILTGGERKREVLLNFGLELDAERQVVLTAGQLQERLEFGTEGNQEWVKQNEFGLAYETTNYAFSVYHVDSETTDNFVGAKSTGAELSGSVEVSDALTMGFGAGYQTLDWDDGSEGVNGLTASLDLGYQANATTRLNVFADRNMSENQFGFGGSLALGAGTLDATYTRIDGRVGAVTDDNRLAVAFTMPLGGQGNATVSRSAGNTLSAGATPSSTLLSDVMTRPGYLPERVIVKAEAQSCYKVTSNQYAFAANVLQGIKDEFGEQARFVDWLEIGSGFGNSAGELDAFLDNAGLVDGMEAWVTNNGHELAAPDVRFQVFNSAGVNPSGYYFVVGQLQSYELTLGRWNSPKRALAYIC